MVLPPIDRLAIRTYDESKNIITDCDEERGWLEDGVEQNEYGEWIMTRIFHPYTDSQLAERQLKKEEKLLAESRRQMSLDEVVSLFIKLQINVLDIPDQTSLRMLDYYPSFTEIVGTTVKNGYKFIYNDELYKTIQDETVIQAKYPPGTGNLYEKIELERTGAIYDPIPYKKDMRLSKGLYYIQNGVRYKCERDNEKAEYCELKDLIGRYIVPHDNS